MRKYLMLLTIIICSLFLACQSSKKVSARLPQETEDAKGRKMLLGKGIRQALLNEPYSSWFSTEYQTYRPDSGSCTLISPLLSKITFEVFLGTWCGDSKREVPHFLKIADQLGISAAKIQLIFVSNDAAQYRKSPQHEEEGKNIVRVPTFILYKEGIELGRIIEYPINTLEKDVLTILSGKNYTPNYATLKATPQ